MTVTHTYTNGKCNDCGVAEPVEECEHNYKIEKDANGHWEICTKCNTIKEGSLVEHTVEIWIDNENGTHSGNCKVCQYTLTRTHEFENGICADCELQEGCEHNYEMKSDNTHHWEACNKCEMIKENSKVNHTVTTAINNKNGTHTGTCTVCNYAVTESHSNGTSGDCETCDYVGDDNGNNNDDNNNNNGDDNNNNNDDENNNQNDNNNNGNDNSSEDGTQADGKIPQTGINSVIAISSIAGLAILGINAIIRLRRYKDVK